MLWPVPAHLNSSFAIIPLVLMVQQMTVKYRHALDYRIGEVENHIHRAVVRNAYGIQPRRLRARDTVCGIGQKMHLMYVKGM